MKNPARDWLRGILLFHTLKSINTDIFQCIYLHQWKKVKDTNKLLQKKLSLFENNIIKQTADGN